MKRLICALALFATPAFVASQPSVSVTVGDSSVEAEIELAGGVEADLTIDFEEVVGLSESSIGLSAELVDPLDSELLTRLPDPSDITLPVAFPMLIQIEPPSSGGLSFTGVVEIELHTHNLTYVPSSPLRLFAAPLGGAFEDITKWAGSGSYRVGGSKGGFSEFLIGVDGRPALDVIDLKFDLLQDTLDDNAESIDPSALVDLQAALDAAWSWRASSDFTEAAAAVGTFIDEVKTNSGAAIPEVWRSSRDLVNVAGELRSRAASLRFSLNRASAP